MTEEERPILKKTLWGGPEDGTEVDIIAGQQDVFIAGPNSVTPMFGSFEPEMHGRYTFVGKTGRFEWKGYEVK